MPCLDLAFPICKIGRVIHITLAQNVFARTLVHRTVRVGGVKKKKKKQSWIKQNIVESNEVRKYWFNKVKQLSFLHNFSASWRSVLDPPGTFPRHIPESCVLGSPTFSFQCEGQCQEIQGLVLLERLLSWWVTSTAGQVRTLRRAAHVVRVLLLLSWNLLFHSPWGLYVPTWTSLRALPREPERLLRKPQGPGDFWYVPLTSLAVVSSSVIWGVTMVMHIHSTVVSFSVGISKRLQRGSVWPTESIISTAAWHLLPAMECHW